MRLLKLYTCAGKKSTGKADDFIQPLQIFTVLRLGNFLKRKDLSR
jgi:hypothetical protein